MNVLIDIIIVSLCLICLFSQVVVSQKQHNVKLTHPTIFANTTVYSAMILTDPMISGLLGRDFHKVPEGVNGTAVENAKARIAHGKQTASLLPFKVEFWYSLYASSCPNRKNKGNDRGVTVSHYQIWHDFVWQGNYVNRQKNKGFYPHFPQTNDNDVIVIFEDDAELAVTNIEEILRVELTQMTTDLLFLGWCYGARSMPSCLHAYVLTRKGARNLLSQFDTCSAQALDGQLIELGDAGIITWRKPSDFYKQYFKPGRNNQYFTKGIFTQKKGFVSFNHHGFQNNAG